jgi:hypothetical protein
VAIAPDGYDPHAMAEVKLNWAEASVKKGKLAVPLAGDAPKGFKDHFETTVKLLGHGRWGKVEVKKKVVHVAGIDHGEPDDLRFYLESLIDQANSAVAAEQTKKDEGKGKGKEVKGDDEPDGPDAELTERFRSYADSSSESESEPDSGSESDS